MEAEAGLQSRLHSSQLEPSPTLFPWADCTLCLSFLVCKMVTAVNRLLYRHPGQALSGPELENGCAPLLRWKDKKR